MPIAAASPVETEKAAYKRALAPYLSAVAELAHEVAVVEAYRAVGEAVTSPLVGAVNRAVERLGAVIQETQQKADVLGRVETIRAADRLAAAGSGGGSFTRPPGAASGAVPFEPGAPLPRVPFTEAVADVMSRDARLARGAADVAAAYNDEHGFALARSESLVVTRRVQSAIAKAGHDGATRDEAVLSIRRIVAEAGADMADWTRAYAETAFSTNVSTAYSAGRFRQMADPAVAFAIGALMFDGPADDDARPNHVAALGLIAAPDDPVWHKLAPPLGWG